MIDWLPSADLTWKHRIELLKRQLVSFKAHVMCLQEVTPEAAKVIFASLKPFGYEGVHLKRQGKPDGCAVIFSTKRWVLNCTLVAWLRVNQPKPSAWLQVFRA